MSPAMDTRIVQLFDALVASPGGLTIHDIGDVLGLNVTNPVGRGRSTAFAVIRSLRLKLGALNSDGDDRLHGYSIPIRRDGMSQLYVLSANRSQSTEWQGVRADTALSRMEVDLAHWRSLVANTDGRTVDGRIARVMLRHFTRLQEDLQDIRAGI